MLLELSRVTKRFGPKTMLEHISLRVDRGDIVSLIGPADTRPGVVPFLTSSDRPVASVLTLVFLVTPLLLFALVDLSLIRVYRKRGIA